jgi:predicted esterase
MANFTGDTQPGVNPRFLVVIVHGLSRALFDSIPPEVRKQLPNADIFTPLYDSGYLSNIDPTELAAELCEKIQDECDRHEQASAESYEGIILIGHSRGAALVRKAFVLAAGCTQERDMGGALAKPKPWHRLVTRIILMAGLNRGIQVSLREKPVEMSRAKPLLLCTADRGATLLRQSRLLRGMKRGSPFIANLRVQWIHLANTPGFKMPLTVQILGDKDDTVLPADNVDVQSSQGYVFLNAPSGTKHGNVVDITNPGRRRVFLKALLEPNPVSEYEIPASQLPDASVSHVVFVMHGIRDFGGWTGKLSSALQQRAAELGKNIEVRNPRYGYFPMLRFLLFSERQKNVRWFMDEYTEARAKYPKAEFEFVGHSNGTYLLASALRKYKACEFNRAVFAGSVVPRSFEWDRVMGNRIKGIRNYVAAGDWVVALFPRMFEKFGDVGAAGFLGFTDSSAVKSEFQCVQGGHGAAVKEKNFPSICAYILEDKKPAPPEEICAEEQVGWLKGASNFCWALWILMIALLVGAGWTLGHFFHSLVLVGAYVAIVLTVLGTV